MRYKTAFIHLLKPTAHKTVLVRMKLDVISDGSENINVMIGYITRHIF